MGVPTSGALSLRNIARERLYGNYGGGGTITGAVAMYDLLNGGNSGGSGNTYPAINGGAGNVSPNGSMESWYGYCQNWVTYYPTGSNNYAGKKVNRIFDACPAGNAPDSYWASDELTNAQTGGGWTVNSTILYDTNAQPCSGGTVTVLANEILVIYLGTGATSNTYVQTNSSGVVTSITQC
tara:strand:- start:122 stop:664 length:543 start_codon:yes stop_codon:yes gene_type:complete